ncbi:MAG: 30S ribosomal protein S20 [Actinomycetota bacterium]|nr:30S ribosomal protein S20 [Actinomycetota bacterium]
MANIKSQIKRNRQNERARVRNLSTRSQLKTFNRRFREALTSGNREEAQKALLRACRAYDKAAAAGVVHANNAANHKSKLQRAFNKSTAA